MNKEKLLNDSILKLSLKINGKDSFYFFTRLGKAYHKLEELFFSIYEKNIFYAIGNLYYIAFLQ